jgi:hypothetical protein
VLDAAGRLAGVAVRAANGGGRLVPVSALAREFDELLGAVAADAGAPRAPVDLIYERAMPVSFQVIAAPWSRRG